MRLRIETIVNANLSTVVDNFDRNLFLKLSPPFPKVDLLVFDGCKKGNIVSLELNFLFFKQKWTSEIVEELTQDDHWFFIDKGTELPFFLKSWTHRHEVHDRGDYSVIVDDIHFTTGTQLTDWLMYPSLWLQFLYRKPVYKKYFLNT